MNRLEPNFNALDDFDLLSLLIWTEKKMSPQQVFELAHSMVGVECPDFEDWCENPRPLGRLVRNELIRACTLNFESGRMWKLKFFAYFYNYGKFILKHSAMAIIAFSIVFLLTY